MSKTQKKKLAQAAALAQQSPDDSMPQMPILPDPRIKYLWSGNPDIREFDFSKFIQLWPAYLDSDLSLADGRRIAKEFCCQAPRVDEMSEICQMLRLRHVLEPFKRYPRSFWRAGRIRVQIVNPDGSYCNEEIKSKNDLLKKMGTSIGKLNSRVQRLQAEAQQLEKLQQSQQQQAQGAEGAKKNPKKGKKKGK